jgi:phosphate acetyltransferase
MLDIFLPHTPVSTADTRHHVLNDLVEQCAALPLLPTAVCYPCSDVALAGAVEAFHANLIRPVLVGPRAVIEALARDHHLALDDIAIIDIADEEEAAVQCVALCRRGETLALMKGSLHTDVLMRAVMAPNGLRGPRRLSHVFVMEAPAYPRPLLITDAAINIQPTVTEKADIAQNAIELAHALGIATPHVAILSAVETINPAIASTLDAAVLCKMADRGQISGGVLDGPLAFDTAISAEAAAIKQLHSPVAGKTDIALVPDLESGNMLAKQLEYLGGAHAAGIVLGAVAPNGRGHRPVPIILTSRADSAASRLASCAVAVRYAQHSGGS